MGIIGTGATAVQVVPHVAASAAELFVFQRTPSSIDVRANRPTDASWASSLEPGWQRKRMENFTLLTSGGMAAEDLVMDGWTDIIGRLVTRLRDTEGAAGPDGDLAGALELADFEKMEQIRSRVDALVTDPATAEALKPWYRQFCKRPCFHDEYLQAFNRPNVTLVSTDGRGVDRITPGGVIVGEREYSLDCLIYATGFEVGTDYTRRAGYDVVGSRGLSLSEYWSDGMKSLHGMHVHGFPNMFVLGHTQGGFTVNYPHLLDEASRHLCHILRHAIDDELSTVEATAQAEEEWLTDAGRIGPGHPRLPGAVHPRLLQQRGSARRGGLPGQLVRQRPDAVLPASVRLAGRGNLRRAGATPPSGAPRSAILQTGRTDNDERLPRERRTHMKTVLILGAGFAGLELATRLSEEVPRRGRRDDHRQQ